MIAQPLRAWKSFKTFDCFELLKVAATAAPLCGEFHENDVLLWHIYRFYNDLAVSTGRYMLI